MNILFPLPDHGFDPTETAVPWRALRDAGHTVTFATPSGRPAAADERILSGRGFGPLRPMLRATRHARATYAEMIADPAFTRPVGYDELDPADCDALVLTGGHAPGMRTYLESNRVQACTASAMKQGKPVGAICHGVLVPARAIDPDTGRSVLWGRRTTALLRSQELAAWAATRAWLGSYYRTYPEPVESEVRRALASAEDFARAPMPLRREHPDRPDQGFTVRDRSYLSARFYGDAYRFARDFVAIVDEHAADRGGDGTRADRDTA